MHRIDTDGSIAGLFSEGAPELGQQPTVVSADWLNDVQENLLGVLTAGGITPEKGEFGQLTDAILALIGGGEGEASPVDQVASYGMPTRAGVGSGNDLDLLTRSGFYVAASDTAHRPPGMGAGLVVSAGNIAVDGDGAQIFVSVAGSHAWVRARNAGVWGSWVSMQPQAQVDFAAGWKIDADGYVRQWGTVSGFFNQGTVAVPWPIAFPNACLGMNVTVRNVSGDGAADIWGQVRTVSPTAGSVYLQSSKNEATGVAGFFWEAWGH